jgi:hypothetical protein
MRPVVLGAVVWCLLGVSASGQTADPALMVPIQKFIDSFNKGDAAAAAATHATGADLTIIDEVSPYLWRGPQAFQAWSADLDADSRKRGITDQLVTIGPPSREETSGDHAYVVVPAVYAFKERGVAMREAAHFTFALRRSPAGWLIHGWTWTGPKPEPVTPGGA